MRSVEGWESGKARGALHHFPDAIASGGMKREQKMLKSLTKNKKTVACAIVAAAALVGVHTSQASTIKLLSWQPVPGSPTLPDITYTDGGSVQTGTDAIGNGDGTLPVANQTAGGLQSDTVVTAADLLTIPGSFSLTGATGFYDTTLTFTGLAVAAPASQNPFVPGQDDQILGPGTFTLTSTTPTVPTVEDPLNPATETVLLQGTIGGAVISGEDGGTSGSIVNFGANDVNYTGGAIFNDFPSNYRPDGNSMAISLVAINPPLGIDGSSGFLNSFTSSATGVNDVLMINVVPEPGSVGLGLTALGLVALGSRRRRKLA